MNKYTAIGAIGAITGATYLAMNFSQDKLQALFANDDEDWLSMPDGKMYHKSCIYHHDTDFKVGGVSESVQTLTKENEHGELTTEELAPCAYESRKMK